MFDGESLFHAEGPKTEKERPGANSRKFGSWDFTAE